ncbi:MAG: dipeptide epimerase [Desulfobulbaceae bacterium]|nr:dipeptide epimerase [Desulfobulbaceae bacterium]
MMNIQTIKTRIERWPIAGTFTISRGSKTEAVVVVVEICDGEYTGRGECVPYARYGESIESVVAAIEKLGQNLNRQTLQSAIPAGAARNALDCAFWDLEAKRAGCPAYELAGMNAPKPLVVSYTLSLDTPEKMAEAASRVLERPLLKIKLGANGDPDRLKAVRKVAPNMRLIVDANEGWTAENLAENLSVCQTYGVELVEQPLPAAEDAVLACIPHAVPICADESAFDRASLAKLADKYDAINVKLDKTGGLTEALAMATQSLKMGLDLMVGCMVSTSLAIAPALLVAQQASVVDLDGPLLLAKDRADGLRYADGLVYPPTEALWG